MSDVATAIRYPAVPGAHAAAAATPRATARRARRQAAAAARAASRSAAATHAGGSRPTATGAVKPPTAPPGDSAAPGAADPPPAAPPPLASAAEYAERLAAATLSWTAFVDGLGVAARGAVDPAELCMEVIAHCNAQPGIDQGRVEAALLARWLLEQPGLAGLHPRLRELRDEALAPAMSRRARNVAYRRLCAARDDSDEASARAAQYVMYAERTNRHRVAFSLSAPVNVVAALGCAMAALAGGTLMVSSAAVAAVGLVHGAMTAAQAWGIVTFWAALVGPPALMLTLVVLTPAACRAAWHLYTATGGSP